MPAIRRMCENPQEVGEIRITKTSDPRALGGMKTRSPGEDGIVLKKLTMIGRPSMLGYVVSLYDEAIMGVSYQKPFAPLLRYRDKGREKYRIRR